MGRQPCCDKVGLKRGPWSAEEDRKLVSFLTNHGYACWREVPKRAGLLRCGKSCRLRWTNYLRPDLRRGQLSDAEEQLIIDLHAAIGNRWSRIAAQLPGRTDNEIKNYWNTRIKKKLKKMGIDPVTHKPVHSEQISQSSAVEVHHQPKASSLRHDFKDCKTENEHNSGQDESMPNRGFSTKRSGSGKVKTVGKHDGTGGHDDEKLSKKEKMELESREAHMRVEKMRAALEAFYKSSLERAYLPPPSSSSPVSGVVNHSPTMSAVSSCSSVMGHRDNSGHGQDYHDFSSNYFSMAKHVKTSCPQLFPPCYVVDSRMKQLAEATLADNQLAMEASQCVNLSTASEPPCQNCTHMRDLQLAYINQCDDPLIQRPMTKLKEETSNIDNHHVCECDLVPNQFMDMINVSDIENWHGASPDECQAGLVPCNNNHDDLQSTCSTYKANAYHNMDDLMLQQHCTACASQLWSSHIGEAYTDTCPHCNLCYCWQGLKQESTGHVTEEESTSFAGGSSSWASVMHQLLTNEQPSIASMIDSLS